MRVVIAPDKFAGTLSAAEACAAIADGWRHHRPHDDLRCVPMADGGAGTLDVVAAAGGGTRHDVEVADPRGHAVMAHWLSLPDGRALIESAQACGLHLVGQAQRNPRTATTYGVGQLIAAALGGGAEEVIVALGGSATVDGGAGMATALGHRLLREDGNGVKVGAEFLASLHRILPREPLAARILAAVDVDAPLLGPAGAVMGFAQQKGAGPDDLAVLEDALTRLADIAERDLPGGPWRDIAGAGAAGGLGFGLAAFAGAELVPGVDLVTGLVGLEDAVAGADVVITGEGRMDAWSLRGKVPSAVLSVARRHGATAMAAVGQVEPGLEHGFDAIAVLGPEGLTQPVELLSERAAELAAAVRG